MPNPASDSSAPGGESPEHVEFQSKPGEYYDPRDTGFHVHLLRARFLSLACKYRPEIAEELNGTLYECFQRTRMKARVPDPTRPPLPELQAALEEWQGKWGLQEEWITYMVMDALHKRATSEQPSRAEDFWEPGGITDLPPIPLPPFQFEYEAWQPTHMRWEPFEKQLKRALTKYNRKYREEIREQLERLGYKKVPLPRLRGSKGRKKEEVSPDRHLEWFLRRNVPDPRTRKPWSQKRLAKEYGVSWRTVKEALDRTAALLG